MNIKRNGFFAILKNLWKSHVIERAVIVILVVLSITNATALRNAPTENNKFTVGEMQIKVPYVKPVDANLEEFVINTKEKLTPTQIANLQLAYKIAKEDGFDHPEILQGLIYQETKAGGLDKFRVVVNSGDNSYFGIGQIKLAAAKDVLKTYPELNRFGDNGKFSSDDEIKAHLILDDEFNIRVASKYLLMQGTVKTSMQKKITSYNTGYGGSMNIDSDQHPYTRNVLRHAKMFVAGGLNKIKPIAILARNNY